MNVLRTENPHKGGDQQQMLEWDAAWVAAQRARLAAVGRDPAECHDYEEWQQRVNAGLMYGDDKP